MTASIPWRISLHGGHSGEFCDHAHDRLEEIIEAAIARGCPAYGVTEHAPRVEPHRLYDEEIALGWTVESLDALFTEYARTLKALQEKYAGLIEILCGFETEVVPEDRYVEVMNELRTRHGFEYIVASVHWVAGHIIDYKREHFDAAVAACGGLEALAIRYYDTVAEMVQGLRPEIVGHLDLVRKMAPAAAVVETPPIQAAAFRALDRIAECGAILDVNTAALRKGQPCPYPAPWLVRAALERGIPFCFGDDSHGVEQVAAGLPEARQYLLDLGVPQITVLSRAEGGLTRNTISL
jgi:histidinol-phosphatase (PHP family)